MRWLVLAAVAALSSLSVIAAEPVAEEAPAAVEALAADVAVIVTPYLGVFVYLIARGHKMAEHTMQAAQAQDAAAQAYIREAAGTSTSAADELARLADLRDKGVIDDAEFQALKAKVVA
mgnify:CR=1 FL=1